MNFSQIKQTMRLRAFGLLKVPLILSVRPTVIRLENGGCEVKIPLNYWTRNHLKSMYFGTLAIGADCAGGLLAMSVIDRLGKKVSIVFKNFKADFLKRPEGDVHFICHDGKKIEKIVRQTIRTGKRTQTPLNIIATVPKLLGDKPVAKFVLTLSVKLIEK